MKLKDKLDDVAIETIRKLHGGCLEDAEVIAWFRIEYPQSDYHCFLIYKSRKYYMIDWFIMDEVNDVFIKNGWKDFFSDFGCESPTSGVNIEDSLKYKKLIAQINAERL